MVAFLLATSTILGLIANAISLGGLTTRQEASDRVCDTHMCVSVSVEGDLAQYVLQSNGNHEIGWLAVGFGQRMGGSPMVIMWPHDDNSSVTLSQRKAPYETMPRLDENPPFTASLVQSATKLDGSDLRMAFSRPAPENLDDEQDVIWAYSHARPKSTDVDASLSIHDKFGVGKLRLVRVPSSPESTPTASQATIVVHAMLGIIGTLILIPLGAVWARYAKMVHIAHPTWFRYHWYIQYSAGVFIILTVLAGFRAGTSHFNDAHKIIGGLILVVYFIQVGLGNIVHRSEDVSTAYKVSLQHATVGSIIIGASFYQARIGYKHEWPAVTHQDIYTPFEVSWWTLILFWPAVQLVVFIVLPRLEARAQAKTITRHDLAMESLPLRAGETYEA